MSVMSTGSAAKVEELVCPECRQHLHATGETLRCVECQKTWPVKQGIPHFVDEFPYWGEIPVDSMREVNRRARSGNWKSALTESPDPVVTRASQMMLNLDRGNWHWLTNLPPTSRVLDLGAGTGTLSHALGLYYREVVAVEPVLERIEFVNQRINQEKLSNVKIVRSSVWKLPFSAASFDLVAMNGVLEWVPEGQEGNPREVQLRVLRRCLDLLRPGGCLYVGIENRTAWGSFIGYRDPHCGVPWVTVMPRRMADWYARRKGIASGYRNYLYSSRGYRKLLQEAGFTRVETYVAAPSYNHPRYLVPLDSKVFSYYVRNFENSGNGVRSLVRECLLRAGLLQYLQYSYAILAYK